VQLKYESIYHYASDKSCSDFNPKKAFGVWRPGSARTRWGSLQRSPDLLAGFKSEDRDKGRRKGKHRRGGQLREENRESTERGGEGEEDVREGDEKERRNLAPTVISESRRLWPACNQPQVQVT